MDFPIIDLIDEEQTTVMLGSVYIVKVLTFFVGFDRLFAMKTEHMEATQDLPTVSDPQLKFGGNLCEAYAKRSLHELNHFLQ